MMPSKFGVYTEWHMKCCGREIFPEITFVNRRVVIATWYCWECGEVCSQNMGIPNPMKSKKDDSYYLRR